MSFPLTTTTTALCVSLPLSLLFFYSVCRRLVGVETDKKESVVGVLKHDRSPPGGCVEVGVGMEEGTKIAAFVVKSDNFDSKVCASVSVSRSTSVHTFPFMLRSLSTNEMRRGGIGFVVGW